MLISMKLQMLTELLLDPVAIYSTYTSLVNMHSTAPHSGWVPLLITQEMKGLPEVPNNQSGRPLGTMPPSTSSLAVSIPGHLLAAFNYYKGLTLTDRACL